MSAIILKKAVNHEGHEGTPRKSIDCSQNRGHHFGDLHISVNQLIFRETLCSSWFQMPFKGL